MITHRGVRQLLVTLIGVALVGSLIYVVWPRPPRLHVEALFPRAVALYRGDEVRVLGVPVGSVTAVNPTEDAVRVGLEMNAEQPIPAEAKAAIVAPSLVTGRYVQLAPAYDGGPRMADGAVIPPERTAAPVEWDQTKKQLTKLARNLGPNGANSDGALTRLLDTGANNLSGQGGNVRDTVGELSKAMDTIASGRQDMFGTIRSLDVFVSALKGSDTQVREFSSRLADVSETLDVNRGALASAVATTDRAFQTMNAFVAKNRAPLTATSQKLGETADTLADNRQSLADALHLTPVTLSNFYNIYDPVSGSLTGGLALANLRNPAQFACSALFSLGGTPQLCEAALGPLANVAKVSQLPLSVTPLQRPGTSNQVDGQGKPVGSGPTAGGLDELLLPGLDRGEP